MYVLVASRGVYIECVIKGSFSDLCLIKTLLFYNVIIFKLDIILQFNHIYL